MTVDILLKDGSSHAANITKMTSADWPDLALLEVFSYTSAFIARLGGALSLGEVLYARGFPQYGKQQREDGVEGKFEGSTFRRLPGDDPQRQWPSLPLIKFKNAVVIGGFSGSPLLNLRTCEVVGVVSESRGLNAPIGGWAIPALSAMEIFPELPSVQSQVSRETDYWQAAIKQAAAEAIPPTWLNFRPPFDTLAGTARSGKAEGAARFLYTSRGTKFHGRREEIAMLLDFASSSADFCWLALTGSSGTGKSRTALQLLDTLGMRWDGGFLPRREASDFRWNDWRPILPTFIVIDDAEVDNTDAIRALSAILARRAVDTPGGLGWPVRLLILGRNLSFMQAALSDHERERVDGSRYGADLTLTSMPVDDITAFVGEICPDCDASALEHILNEVARIDPERRPLFAQFAAEAVRDGQAASAWDQIDLLRYILQRERNSRWVPSGVTDEDRRLVMFGTLCAPLSLSGLNTEARNHSGPVSPVPSERKRRVETMLGIRFPRAYVPALQPDLLGTIFVLDELLELHEDDSEFKTDCLLLAWRLNPLAVGLLARRAIEELPEHPQAAGLLEIDPEPATLAPWAEASSFAIEQKHSDWAKVIGRLRQHRSSLMENVGLLIANYEKSRSAGALESLWSMVLCIFKVDIDLHRLEYDALWRRVMALELPHHSLLVGQNFDVVRGNLTLLANLDAVFAIWSVKATSAAQTLHYAHRKCKDRVSAKFVRQTLAAKAASLSADNGSNFDGGWLNIIKARRRIAKERHFSKDYRPSQGGILLSEAQKELAKYAHERDLFVRKPWYQFTPSENESGLIDLQFTSDVERGYMLVENGMHWLSEPYAREIVVALKRDYTDPEYAQHQQRLLLVAHELLSAATSSASAN